MTLHDQVHAAVFTLLARKGTTEQKLFNVLRYLAKYRSQLIQNSLVKLHGTKVQGGPFSGMDFFAKSTEGCHVPKLLGCYEQELHETLIGLPERGYQTIINIGCAEGYYAIGIKRLLPNIRVLAHDIDPTAQTACKALAAKNNVDIEVGGEFRLEDFAQFADQRVLVWCDIEGAESDLLDPAKAPALARMDLVVELHATPAGHTRDIVPRRFSESHEIKILETLAHSPALPTFLKDLGHLDQLLAQWEWREKPTPWAVMHAKSG